MLPNDVCRCEGWRETQGQKVVCYCPRRRECARYVERNAGGERTPHGQYLCDDADMFIPVDTLK
jgi:hypothetical protein